MNDRRPAILTDLERVLFPDGAPAALSGKLLTIRKHLHAAAWLSGRCTAAPKGLQRRAPPAPHSPVEVRRRAKKWERLTPEHAPLGLVPARVVAAVMQVTPRDVLTAMKDYDIVSCTPKRGVTEKERWKWFAAGWGQTKALAWFDAHPGKVSAALRRRFVQYLKGAKR